MNPGPNIRRRLATLLLTFAFSRVSIHAVATRNGKSISYPERLSYKSTSKGFKIQLRKLYSSRIPVKNACTGFYGHTSTLNFKQNWTSLALCFATTPAITRTFHPTKPKKVRVSGSSIKLTGNKEISKWMGIECTPRQRDLTFLKRN